MLIYHYKILPHALIQNWLVNTLISHHAQRGFIAKRFANHLSDKIDDMTVINQVLAIRNELADLYQAREFAKAVKLIMTVVDEVNQYVDTAKPWLLAKEDGKDNELHQVC